MEGNGELASAGNVVAMVGSGHEICVDEITKHQRSEPLSIYSVSRDVLDSKLNWKAARKGHRTGKQSCMQKVR